MVVRLFHIFIKLDFNILLIQFLKNLIFVLWSFNFLLWYFIFFWNFDQICVSISQQYLLCISQIKPSKVLVVPNRIEQGENVKFLFEQVISFVKMLKLYAFFNLFETISFQDTISQTLTTILVQKHFNWPYKVGIKFILRMPIEFFHLISDLIQYFVLLRPFFFIIN